MNLKNRVQSFWNYFKSIQNDFERALRNQDNDLIDEYLHTCNERLKTISGCKMEVEVTDNGFFELTFDAQDRKNAQYICALLKKDAPETCIDNWIINSYRQPLGTKAYHTVLQVNGRQFKGSDFTIYYDIDEVNKCIPIKVYCDGFASLDEVKKQEITIYMLALFIGELELEARIGQIEIVDEPLEEENVCLLPNFYEDICDIIINMDWVEYHDPTQIYMAYKLHENIQTESLRKDMKLIMTTHCLLQEELLNNEFGCCQEMKEKGAEYGYIYYEPKQEKEQIARTRQQLEKELQELLYPVSIGRTIGGAIGTKYAYIDLLIFDKDIFMIVLKRLQEELPFDIYYKSFLPE